MTARELLAFEIENVGGQLRGVLAGLPEELQDSNLCPSGMSPRTIVKHLAEAYHATVLSARGEKYEWGTFALEDKSFSNLVETMWSMRQQATDAVMKDDDTTLRSGFEYIVAHDAYHVGQLSSLRVEKDPAWDPYSIYS